MTSDRVYLDCLEDLLDALQKAEQFVAGMSFEQWCEVILHPVSFAAPKWQSEPSLEAEVS